MDEELESFGSPHKNQDVQQKKREGVLGNKIKWPNNGPETMRQWDISGAVEGSRAHEGS